MNWTDGQSGGQNIRIDLSDDDVDEPDEMFRLEVTETSPEGILIGSADRNYYR